MDNTILSIANHNEIKQVSDESNCRAVLLVSVRQIICICSTLTMTPRQEREPRLT